MQQGLHALQDGNYIAAEGFALRLLRREPLSPLGLLLAGQATAAQGQWKVAGDYFDRLQDLNNTEAIEARLSACDFLLSQGRVSDVERGLRRILTHRPGHPRASFQLGYLLSVEGRCWECAPFLLNGLKQPQFALQHLMWVGQLDAMLRGGAAETIRTWRAAVPDDPVPLIGLARIALLQHDTSSAEMMLREVVSRAPDQSEAQAQLGRILVDKEDATEFHRWHAKLSSTVDCHPEIWVVRGHWAELKKEFAVAARCFWEAVRRDPNHRTANYRLAQILYILERPDDARPFLERSTILDEFQLTLEQFGLDVDNPRPLARLAQQCEDLGRIWEALGWSHVALDRDSQCEWALLNQKRLPSLLESNSPQTLSSSNPTTKIDLSGYPLPGWSSDSIVTDSRRHVSTTKTSVRFEEVPEESGLVFQYLNIRDPEHKVTRMFEATGGGVAVLDFDVDGLPDLYFTQSCSWPVDLDRRTHLDQLFRNLGNGRFVEISSAARLFENGYSQGVTIGDYDNDGFPDLYIANIGANRFFHNQGDGTFVDVTLPTGTAGADWSTSCLMADLNQDSFPDLYVVNYIAGDDVYERNCVAAQGTAQRCKPTYFPAAQDRVYVNLGDGHFEEQTQTAGIVTAEGRGLGVVGADFDGSGRISLFVANDGEANFYYANETLNPGSRLNFVERGLQNGLAFDQNGQSQACMGIAAGDADADGRLDLFVTNYYQESNTLYVQRNGGLFEDYTFRAKLREPSMHKLGWGTQFLDGELDGILDLVVTNGHEGNFIEQGIPYEMPPQYFKNLGDARFTEIFPPQLGKYFEGKYLGRGLARLDWNRDGREDFAVTHLDRPAALLTNATETHGHFLAVHVRGVRSSRDAIGTTVRVKVSTSGATLTRQLTAGDGFHASNERCLIFGLSGATEVAELHVHWPSGHEQTWSGLKVDQALLIVEGERRAYVRTKVD